MRGGLWAPGARRRGFATQPRRFVGANPADRHVAPPRAGCVDVERRIAPRRDMDRVGRVVGQRMVHSAYLPPVELPYPPASREPRGPPAALARRPALDTAGPPTRAARLLRPRIVFLCPHILRDRPEKVKPRFGPTLEPHRPGRPMDSAAQPVHRASRPAIASGAENGLGAQVVGFAWPSSSRAHRPNPRRRRIGGRAVQPPLASRPGSCANPRSASQPGPHDRRIPVRSRGRNAIGAIESKFATSSWGTFPTCRPANGTLRAQNGAQNGTGPIK